MQSVQKNKETTYAFRGKITAVTALTVSRPGDKFASLNGSTTMGRLPRMGARREETAVFYSPNTLRHLIRESGIEMIRRHIGSITLETTYMLYQGVDISKSTKDDDTAGIVAAEAGIRKANPALSVFGRWKLPSKLHVAAAVPGSNDCVYIEGAGARKNMFAVAPSRMEALNADDAERVLQMMREDTGVSIEKQAIDNEIKALKKEMKGTSDRGVKESIQQKINAMEDRKKHAKSEKSGSEESIQRPLEGFEAISPGTVMNHSMRLARANKIELGLLLGALREAASNPFVGGHQGLGCGEISASYEVSVFKPGSAQPESIGSVSFGWDGFVVEGDELESALSDWDAALENAESNFDFGRFLCSDDAAAASI